jgi:hypothetical protein
MNGPLDLGALRRFEDQSMPFPAFNGAVKLIESNLKVFHETGLATNLLVLGESGTGKSSLCRHISALHPRHQLPDRDIVSVVAIQVPPAATIRGIVDGMLKALGDPASSSGSLTNKTNRIIHLCKQCRVEILMFDEAQHLQDRGAFRTHYAIGDWFKTVIDQVAVPTVLLGLPRIESLLQVNEQLRRRFSSRYWMTMGQSDKSTVEAECLQLFMSLVECMEVPFVTAPYTWPELGERLRYASDGRVAYVKKLLSGALRICIESGLESIDSALLESVFTRDIWPEARGKLNPFSQSFDFRRLDRRGEPFSRGEFPGRVASL